MLDQADLPERFPDLASGAGFEDHAFLFAATADQDAAAQTSPEQLTAPHPLAQIENATSVWCLSNSKWTKHIECQWLANDPL